jgi:hypothetical protein
MEKRADLTSFSWTHKANKLSPQFLVGMRVFDQATPLPLVIEPKAKGVDVVQWARAFGGPRSSGSHKCMTRIDV